MRIFLFFVDGVGLGEDDPAVNPLVVAEMPAFRSLLGGRPLTRGALPHGGPGLRVISTDPRMDVPGLPQSATGQTALFTGCNAARAIGRHLNYYPTPNLRRILEEHSVFRQVRRLGLSATFLNPFPPVFFDWVAEGQPLHADRRYRPSASTVAALAGGIESFRTMQDLLAGEAVAYDIDGVMMRGRGWESPLVEPKEAGRRAARVAGRHHFTLYEHFLTDKAGHGQSMSEAVRVLERLDRFLAGVLEEQPGDLLLIITSDHGNVEDLSVRTHTAYDVATILRGAGAEAMAPRIRTLMDITPAIVDLLQTAHA